VWSLNGNSVEKVSTTAIDNLLGDLNDTDLSSVFAWSYAQDGAYFVGWTLTDTTIVYDTISGRWHERKTFDVDYDTNSQTDAYRVNSAVKAYGLVLVGDSTDGRIGYLDPDTYTEYSATIRRRFTSQPIQNNMEPLFIPSIELTVESGQGGEGAAAPQVSMSFSRDGRTWSDVRSRRSMGAIGDYERRVIWRRNGRFPRFAIFRFEVSEAYKTVFIGMIAEVEGADA